ncbi:MAG: methanol oxidase, glmU [Proteobacteria bacterium]|nr:MAG: methanol oxidase, glmU [Pseudomonadota bacterium]
MSELRPWSDGIWFAEAPLRFYGIPFGTRMTVVRTSDGSLLLHSPIPLSARLRAQLDAIGRVRHVVAPNKLHHLFLAGALAAYPEARAYFAPGLVEKRPELAGGEPLSDVAPAAWAGTFEPLVVCGSRVMQEVVFLHPSSRTLIVADLCEHFGAHSPWPTRVVARLARMYGRPRMPPDWQLSFRDRAARRSSFERLLAWDFDRVILAHGALLRGGAKRVFEREYAWALA